MKVHGGEPEVADLTPTANLSTERALSPREEQCEFARLISRFAGDIHRHLDEFDA